MIICYRDSYGFPRVEPNDVHPLVGLYMEQDIQGSPGTCDELLAILHEVERGTRSEWSGTGNAHTLTVKLDGISVANEWDESLGQARIPLDLFRQCIEAWRTCISS